MIHTTEPEMSGLTSQLVTQNQMESDVYRHWLSELRENNRYARKQWEHIYILQALHENNLLRDGVRGVGFGVGKEPLPAVMARHGCAVLATEINIEKPNKTGWVKGRNLEDQLRALNDRGICEDTKFRSLIRHQDVNMNHIPEEIRDYDFTWSSCSLEHLGSLKLGEDFIFNSLKCIKPGGIAVHTTEYTLSKVKTVERGSSVYYRQSDIISLAERLLGEGHEISLNFSKGRRLLDWRIDFSPYRDTKHLKLLVSKQWKLLIATSIGLIIKKSGRSGAH